MTKNKRAFILSLIATIILPIFLGMFLEELFDLSVILAVGLILPIMITGLLFIKKPETSKTGGMIILIMGGMGIAGSILLGLGGGVFVILFWLGAIMAIIGGHLGIKLAIEKEDEKTKEAFVLSLIATVTFIWLILLWQGIVGNVERVAWSFLGRPSPPNLAMTLTISSIGLIISMMILGLFFMRKEETLRKGGAIILITGIAGMALKPILGPLTILGATMAITGGYLATKKEDEKTKEAFVLSLIATTMFIWPIFFWRYIMWNVERAAAWGFLDHPSPELAIILIVGSIGLMILMMITGLLFMRKEETSQRGGTIVLTAGAVGMAMVGPILGPVIILGSVIATIGGYLAIKEEDGVKQYSKAFIISTIGFVSALLSVFIYFWIAVKAHEWDIAFLQLFGSFPLWMISVILNTISTVVRRKEPEKRTKILIIVTWCLIALLVVLLFLSFWMMQLR